MITLIVARDRHGAIGSDGMLPFNCPQDLTSFKRETIGGCVIMGRKTWESLPTKPLAGRGNIVITSTPFYYGEEVAVDSVEAALDRAYDQGYSRIYGIGGTSIYEALIHRAHRLLITEMKQDVHNPDTFFPPVMLAQWVELPRTVLQIDPYEAVRREFIKRYVAPPTGAKNGQSISVPA